MATKKTYLAKFDFYRFNFFDKQLRQVDPPFPKIEDLLVKAYSDQALKSVRTVDEGVRLHRLETLIINGVTVHIGEVARIRMGNIPPIMGIDDGAEHVINLTDDQGLAERTTFLYDPNLQVLCYHRNRRGVSISKFLGLLEGVLRRDGDEETRIEALQVLEEDAIAKIKRMTTVRKFEIGIAQPDNGTAFQQFEGPLTDVSRMAVQPRAARFFLRWSMGRKKGSLDVGFVLSRIESALRMRSVSKETVTRLLVSGRDDDGSEEIDLLKYRLFSVQEVAYEGRSVSASDLREATARAFNTKMRDLARQFLGRD